MRLNGHVHAAVDLACAQREQGHVTAIASAGGDFDGLLQQNGVETFHLSHERRPAAVLGSVSSLSKLMGIWKPDVVHAHMATSAVIARIPCTLHRIPLITTVHNEFERSAILMGLGTRVIAVSRAVGASMRKRGVPDSRLDVVLNGTIGSARQAGKARDPQPLGPNAIVFVGGLHPRKGLAVLLAAFEAVFSRRPDARLYIVGGGPSEQDYRDSAARLAAAEAITFTGPIDDPYSYMLGAAIFVLPSLADPAPLVISEAREAGCAVIASDVDGIPELLERGDAGRLTPPSDSAALSAAILELLEDRAELEKWRDNSQINIEYLTIGRVAKDTTAVYLRAGARNSTGIGN
jgi:glycosyltransferase involved in cell wall biosynthesis